MLSEAFKKQTTEWRKEKDKNRKSNTYSTQRNSTEQKLSPNSDQYLNPQNYIKPDSTNDTQNADKNSNYISNSDSNDVQPGGRYLEPDKPKISNTIDTYGGLNEFTGYNDDRYLDGFKNIDNQNSARNSDTDQTQNNFVAPQKPPIPPKPKNLAPILNTNDSIYETKDRYLLPRHGSNVSTTSNGSTSSTTPLQKFSVPTPMPRNNINRKNIFKPGNIINESEV